MVVDFIKVEPLESTKTITFNRNVITTVKPRPLSKTVSSIPTVKGMANQQQQIIVIPGNMFINSKQNGNAALGTTMDQVKSILKLANTSQVKTIVKPTNAKSTLSAVVSSNTATKGVTSANKTPVILPNLMKNAGTNAAIVRPVSGISKTAGIKTTCQVPPNNSISLQQQQHVQIASPRVISLKRPYTSISCGSSDASEPNIIKMSSTSPLQGLTSITAECIKEEDFTFINGEQLPVRKRANLDHMSSEEKMMRRKLKNRVAAQNARDKKRVKMDEMDDKIEKLENENKRILEQNEQLMEFNRRLTEENQRLAKQQNVEQLTSFIKVEPQQHFDDIDASHNRVLYIPPESPESLPRSPSPSSSISSSSMTQQHRLSSLDTDDETATTLSSIVSSDSNDISSLVEQRSVEPSEPIHVLQQQEQDRRLAGEEIRNSPEMQELNNSSLLDPATTALFWTCLMTTLLPVVNNLSSQNKKVITSSKEQSPPLTSLNLPPKKRMSHIAAALQHPPSDKRRLPT